MTRHVSVRHVIALVAATGCLAVLATGGGLDRALSEQRVLASIPLSDDDAGQALFAVNELAPGHAVTRCITVMDDSTPGDVVVSAANVSGALAPHVMLTIEIGTGGGFGQCASFVGRQVFRGSLSALQTAPSAAPGWPTQWSPTGSDQRSYRISAVVGSAAAAQGQSATADLVWTLVPSNTPSPSTATATVTTVPPTATPTTSTPTTTTTSLTTNSSTATPTTTAANPPTTSAPAASAPPSQPRPTIDQPSPPSRGSSDANSSSLGFLVPHAALAAGSREPTTGTADSAAAATKPAVPAAANSQTQTRPTDDQVRAASAHRAFIDRGWSPGVMFTVLGGPTAISLLLITLMFVFFLVQRRMDERDPKLVHAPIRPDPPLDYEPPGGAGTTGYPRRPSRP